MSVKVVGSEAKVAAVVAEAVANGSNLWSVTAIAAIGQQFRLQGDGNIGCTSVGEALWSPDCLQHIRCSDEKEEPLPTASRVAILRALVFWRIC